MKFPESALAHRLLDGLKGIEIGGSEHNSFGIQNCINVDCEPNNAHKEKEVELCGKRLKIDVIAEGDDLPFADDSCDFVINSHVIEHMPNPVKAILEWIRVVRDGGYIFFVVPIRDMNPDDRQHPYATAEGVWNDYLTNQTIETHPCHPGQGPRGHYFMWSPMRFAHFIGWAFREKLELVEALERDDKVGNGFTLVMRVIKTRQENS